MRIGLVTQWSDCGAGIVSQAYERTLEREHEVYIYARGTNPKTTRECWKKPNVHWARPHPCLTGIHCNELRAWIEKNGIHAVIFNEQRRWDAVIAARASGALAGAYVDYYTAATVPFFALYDFLVCNTRRHLSVFSWHPQTVLVPWGTDNAVYTPAIVWPECQSPVRFFISAGFDGRNATSDPSLDRRGTGPTLKAFREVTGDWRLIIHSQCPLEQCPREWQETIRSDSRIEFIEATVDPPGLYHMGDVYVYPSRLDGIGLTLPEALASGLMAITTNAPPMNEFVEDGVNGILVDVDRSVARHDGYYWPESIVSHAHFVRVVQDLVDHPAKVTRMKEQARKTSIMNRDWALNSSSLGQFLAAATPTAVEAATIPALSLRALAYDRQNSPTPWQQIFIGAKRLGRSLITRSLIS